MGKKGGGSKDASRAAAVDKETALQQTYADRADQYNPFGNVQWDTKREYDPGQKKYVTKWTQKQTMSDDLSKIYNSQMYKANKLGAMSAGMTDRIQSEMGAAPDWAQFGDVHQMDYDPNAIREAAENAAYTREKMRLDPRFQQMGEQLEIKLRNQGLRPGDQAYEAEMSRLGQTSNDAYERARLGASQTGMQEANQLWGQQLQGTELANALRSQQISEYLAKRQFSLGESQALDPLGQLKDISSVVAGGGDT